jgi:Fe-S cluster biosynthesis and repair protein YggX
VEGNSETNPGRKSKRAARVERPARVPKSMPQGLKAALILQALCRDESPGLPPEQFPRSLSSAFHPIQWGLGAGMMPHTVFCVRNKREMEGLDEPPFDSEFGQKIFKNVSKAAWGEWVERQKMLLNEYRLQPWTPQAQQFLVAQMEEFFFGAGSALPSEFVPPEQ